MERKEQQSSEKRMIENSLLESEKIVSHIESSNQELKQYKAKLESELD